MSPLRRVWNVFRRTRMDDDLQQELDAHLALIEEEEREAGASAEQARQRARSRFGNSLLYRERALDGIVSTRFESACKEIVFASRRLLRSPAFTLATLLTLSLAIGANTAMFTVVQRVVLNPLPYAESGRLIALDYGAPTLNIPSGINWMTWQLYWQLADHARTLETIAVYNVGEATLVGGGLPERIRVSRVTPSLASVLRMSPAFGRWFTEDEGAPSGPSVAVLSHGLWTRRYGGDPTIIGRSLTIDGVPMEVIGVMPASFAFPDARVDLWTTARSTRAGASFLFTVSGIARLRPGVTIANARAEVTSLIADLARTSPNQEGLVSTALPLQEAIVGRMARTLWILFGSVALVLLVACANVANLFLVRSEAKQREIAVRRALGAGRSGVARYFLAESVLLSLAAGAVGLAFAWGAVRLLVVLTPVRLPRLEEVQLDGVVLAFTITVSLIAAIVFGTIPLLRNRSVPLALHDGGRTSTAGPTRHHTRRVLMAAQMALALVLLVLSGLMVRSFQKLRAVDPGFDAASTLAFRIGLPDRDYRTRRAAVAAHHAILDRLSRLPGVTAASASSCLPLEGTCSGNLMIVEHPVVVEESGRIQPWVWWRAVAGDYFKATRIALVRGRVIDRGDVEREEPVVVVNKALADIFFPNQDPIGRRVRSSTPPNSPLGTPPWLTIVGVVSNTPTTALAQVTPDPQLYMPMSIAGGPDIPAEKLIGPTVAAMSYVVRSAMSPSDLVALARDAIGRIDRNLALAQVRTLQESLDQSAAQMAFTMILIGIAAIVALLLGVVGIYGVISYAVSQRATEIGIRLALGAAPKGVSRMIVRQSAIVALAGMAVGLAAAFAGSRFIASLLYGVSPRDPAVFATTALLLFGVALLACWFPARRAARISPLEALRAE